MRRLTAVLLGLAVYMTMWVATMVGVLAPFGAASGMGEVWRFSPMYLLMSFACYSLAVVS